MKTSFKKYLLESVEVDEEKIEKYYQKLLPKLQQIERTFEQVLRSSLPKRIQKVDKFGKAYSAQPIIITNIKPAASVISKVKRGKKIEQIGDMVRGAVLLPDSKSVDEFAKMFVRKNQGIIDKLDIKKFGEDKTYGYYGSQHIDLVISGLRVELQVMTQKLWKMKHYAHQIYTKTRDSGVTTDSDRIQSKNIFKIGNKPKFVKECEVPDDIDALYEFMLIDDRWKLYLD
jgi:hypothetical protein